MENEISKIQNSQLSIDQALQLAKSMFQQQSYQTAQQLLDTILTLSPHHNEALDLLGIIYYQQNNLQLAEQYCRQAISEKNPTSQFYEHLAIILQAQGKFNQAITYYQQALTLNANAPSTYYNLGYAYQQKEQYTQAIHCYQKSLSLDANYYPNYNNLGLCYAEFYEYEEAIKIYQQSIALNKTDPFPHNNIAICYRHIGQYQQAKYHLQTALRLDPIYTAALDNLGQLDTVLGNYTEAQQTFEKIISNHDATPRHHYHFALSLLAAGEFPLAWEKFEYRKALPELNYVSKSYQQPLWQGESLNDKVLLIYDEQGYGDIIQFFRFTKLIKAKKIIFQCNKPLKRLFSNASWIDSTINRTETPPYFDYHIPLLSIPQVLKLSDPNEIFHYPPYLKPQQSLIIKWRKKFIADHTFKVGIIWSGNPRQKHHNVLRSFPVQLLLPLASIPSVQLYSLQMGQPKNELTTVTQGLIIDLTQEIEDFADTAAAMSYLDLIISVDTAPTHLAGALGKTTWVLLNTSADWRWKSNNPSWYTAMTHYRLTQFSNWEGISRQVYHALKNHLDNGNNRCE